MPKSNTKSKVQVPRNQTTLDSDAGVSLSGAAAFYQVATTMTPAFLPKIEIQNRKSKIEYCLLRALIHNFVSKLWFALEVDLSGELCGLKAIGD